ncbi:leucine-rich repeat protein [Planctomycetota bacterium]|nr:leucine-rich repeat protein [Planctomycetota bacterium]
MMSITFRSFTKRTSLPALTALLLCSSSLYAIDLDGDDLLDVNEHANFATQKDNAVVDFGDLGIQDLDGVNEFTDATELSLADNDLTTIAPNTFSNLENLEELDLSRNFDLTSIQTDAFNGLSNLDRLGLYQSHLARLQAGVFNGLDKLDYANIAYNKITTLESNAFQGADNLTRLFLYANQISTIEDEAFANLDKLIRLSIWGNEITNLNLTDASLANLEYIQIEDNDISTVTLTRALLSQMSFSEIFYDLANETILQEIILDEIDFANISDFSNLADAIEQGSDLTLSVQNAINLDEFLLLSLFDANDIDPMSTLNLTGTWDSLSADTQGYLSGWGHRDGHTLIIPEPSTALLLLTSLSPLAFTRRKRKTA